MPRKRPGAIRATRQAAGNPIRQWAHEGGPIDRLSPATTAAIRAVEHCSRLNQYAQFKEHVRPGRTVRFLRDYRNFLRQPTVGRDSRGYDAGKKINGTRRT
jgi:hypothetical protein